MTPRRATDLTHTLVDGLKDMISGGVLHPGSRLPPERELAKQFGVNRASIRQALKALDVMGVVHQRVGDGTYLTQDASTTLSAPLEFLILVDGITFQELLETRLIVEPELAARAAQRATEQDLADLERAMKDVEGAMADGAADLVKRDLVFYEIIWRASGNRICERIFASIHRSVSQGLALTTMLRDSDMPLNCHRDIFEAIRKRDEDGARRAMREHLQHAERTVRKSLAKSKALPETRTLTEIH